MTKLDTTAALDRSEKVYAWCRSVADDINGGYLPTHVAEFFNREVPALIELAKERDDFRESALMYSAMVAERNEEIEKLRARIAELETDGYALGNPDRLHGDPGVGSR